MEIEGTVVHGDSRSLNHLEKGAVSLVVTSPPYWHLKDYGSSGQIGYGQSLHNYLKALYQVWKESYRVLEPGRRLCINIGDQFARSAIYGRYKIIPLHAEFISQCERIGFDFMGSIIWQKKTTMNTTGGATIMGSYPHPPNGIVEIDYEFILIFKKPGKAKKVPRELKERSKLTKEEWKEYFSGHWYFRGERQDVHKAMFPEELPRRLIKMFTFEEETVLDPFLGSGTTMKTALNLGRKCVGYEIHKEYLSVIRKKLEMTDEGGDFESKIEFLSQSDFSPPPVDYTPNIQNAEPQIDPQEFKDRQVDLFKVTEILSPTEVELEDGTVLHLLGLSVPKRKEEEVLEYLREFVKGKEVFYRLEEDSSGDSKEGYLYLKNRIFINKYLLESKMAEVDKSRKHKLTNV